MKHTNLTELYRNRFLQHILFWIVSSYILLQLFTNSGKSGKIDYIYTFLFQCTLVPGIYLNLFVLIPVFLRRRKVIFYIALLVCVTIISVFLNIIFFDKIVDYLLPGYYFISYYEFSDILKFVLAFLVLTGLIKLAKSWFVLSESEKKLTQLQKEKAEIELKALKSQVNPHFLFNSLNVLYSLVLKNSEESPAMIVKLADILRYMIYESGKDFVALSEEVKLISDYIDLQHFRIDNNVKVDFKTHIKEENHVIAPMLFLPLVENSFKHGVTAFDDNAYIDIDLKAESREILFEVENSKGNIKPSENEEYKGIGLSNIRDRLKLLYPSNHLLEIKESDTFFRIKLLVRNES